MNMEIIISLLTGIVIGYVIFLLYSRKKYNIHGPNSKDIIGKIYKKDGKCYKFTPVISICPISISMKH